MAEYPMDSPPVSDKLLDEAKVEDVIQEQPPPYQPVNSNTINLIPTQSESSQRQSENRACLTRTNVNLDYIDNYMGWSIFNILCCWCVISCVACYFSCQTDELKQQGDRQGALNVSRYALNFNRIATIYGMMGFLIYIITIIYFSTNKY
jgi:hypothetical protein